MATMHFRFWCPTHKTFLAGLPELTAEFPRDEGTAFIFDLSNMYCPESGTDAKTNEHNACKSNWEIESGTWQTTRQKGVKEDVAKVSEPK
jgi:hypothetical protein